MSSVFAGWWPLDSAKSYIVGLSEDIFDLQTMSHTYTVHFCTLERELPMADRIAKTVLDNRTVNLSLWSLGRMKLNKQKSEPVVHVMYVCCMGFRSWMCVTSWTSPCRVPCWTVCYIGAAWTVMTTDTGNWYQQQIPVQPKNEYWCLVVIVCDVCVNSHSTSPLPHLFCYFGVWFLWLFFPWSAVECRSCPFEIIILNMFISVTIFHLDIR